MASGNIKTSFKHSARLEREQKTIQLMIQLYCQQNHHSQTCLCLACDTLYKYALQRIEKCPFGKEKPTCAKCPIHCYKPELRAGIRRVMRYAGPRMLLHHPLLTILHFLDEWTHQ